MFLNIMKPKLIRMSKTNNFGEPNVKEPKLEIKNPKSFINLKLGKNP